MSTAREELQRLQESIGLAGDTEGDRLYFAGGDELFHVEYYGSTWDEPYEILLQGLSSPAVATSLKSLTLRGPDEGANGVRNWNLTILIESDAQFPHLETAFIEPTAPEHHNRSIIGTDYDEEGQIARVLAKAPALKTLTVPSAPDASFFQVGSRPLRSLRVETGFAHQDFLLHLSQSQSFPDLTHLDFGDYNQRYIEDYRQDCVPYDHYEQLFRSKAFQGVRVFCLRNSVLAPEQLAHLQSLRKELGFLLIQEYSEYVRES